MVMKIRMVIMIISKVWQHVRRRVRMNTPHLHSHFLYHTRTHIYNHNTTHFMKNMNNNNSINININIINTIKKIIVKNSNSVPTESVRNAMKTRHGET